MNDAEAALRVVKHLHRLQGQWQHILQDSVYERLMGYLLEYVIRLVMKPVFEVFHRVSVPIFFLYLNYLLLQMCIGKIHFRSCRNRHY